MRQESITIYQFDELSDKAKERALSKMREWDVDLFTDSYEEMLEMLGFNNPKISYSGFYSQGDGACFVADMDLEKIAQVLTNGTEEWLEKLVGFSRADYNDLLAFNVFDYLSGSMYHEGNYYHENSVRISWDFRHRSSLIEDYCEAFQDHVEELRKQICQAIYESLQADYEYQTSDECLTELAQNYEFLESGEFH